MSASVSREERFSRFSRITNVVDNLRAIDVRPGRGNERDGGRQVGGETLGCNRRRSSISIHSGPEDLVLGKP